MDELDRREKAMEWMASHTPSLTDVEQEAILLRIEYAWEATVRITGYGPIGPGFIVLVAKMVRHAEKDKARGSLERSV